MNTSLKLRAVEQFWQHVTSPVPATSPQDRAEINTANLRTVLVERDLRTVLVRGPSTSQRSTAALAHGQGG